MCFDATLPVTLQVDASDYGLGGTLLQPNKDYEYQPVAFTSPTLSRAEKNYSQIKSAWLSSTPWITLTTGCLVKIE